MEKKSVNAVKMLLLVISISIWILKSNLYHYKFWPEKNTEGVNIVLDADLL